MRAVTLLALALVLTSVGEAILVFSDRYKNLILAGYAGTFLSPRASGAAVHPVSWTSLECRWDE